MKRAAILQRPASPIKIEILREVVEKNEWELVKEYVKEGPPGRVAEYEQILDSIKNDEFDVLVVYDASRINRSWEELIHFFKVAETNNVKIYSLESKSEVKYDEKSGYICPS